MASRSCEGTERILRCEIRPVGTYKPTCDRQCLVGDPSFLPSSDSWCLYICSEALRWWIICRIRVPGGGQNHEAKFTRLFLRNRPRCSVEEILANGLDEM